MTQFIYPAKQGVPFVSVATMVRLVTELGVENFLQQLVARLEQDFARWPEFDKSPRYASHSNGGVIELMPVSDGKLFSCKFVNGHPKNSQYQLQTVAAFGVLADVATGYPVLLAEMCVLTALRTAATSALVARYLAPQHSTTLALIGCGAQSEFQALAFKAVLGIRHIRLFDIDPEAAAKACQHLTIQQLQVTVCHSVEEAIKGADIITTCTADKCNATILTSDMVPDGVHINAIGGDCPGKTELDSQLLQRATVVVEYEPQSRIEGEIQQMPADFPVTEFHLLVNGKAPGRSHAQQLTIFDGVGFACEDFTALTFIRELLLAEQQATSAPAPELLDLITQQANPKDLFSLLAAPQQQVQQGARPQVKGEAVAQGAQYA